MEGLPPRHMPNPVAPTAGMPGNEMFGAQNSRDSPMTTVANGSTTASAPQATARPDPTCFWDRAVDELAQDKDTLAALVDYQKVLKLSLSAANKGDLKPDEQISSIDADEQAAPSIDIVKDNLQMKQFVAEKLDLMRRKEWVVRWRGKDVFRVRKNVERIVNVVQQCSGLIGEAVSHMPSPAAPAWAGICLLMTLITADNEERTKAIDGLEKVSFVVARAETAERSYFTTGNMNVMFEKAMIGLYRDLITFYTKAACYFSRHTITKFARNVIRYDDWSGILKEIRQKDQEAHKFATTLSLSGLADELRAVRDTLSDEQRKRHVKETLQWTSTIQVSLQHSNAKLRLGTQYLSSGQWLLEDNLLKIWKKLPNGHLWLQGGVGTGKTSLVTILIEHLLPSCENLAYFYCSPTLSITDPAVSVEKRGHEILLRSLIAQLAPSSDGLEVAAELELAFENSRRRGAQGAELNETEAFNLLVQLIESRDTTTIIVDALDECPRYSTFLSTLKSLQTKTNRLKLFVSSQPHVPVALSLPTVSSITITPALNRKDMMLFIEKEMESFTRIRSTINLDIAFRDDIKISLTENSGGMFKWTQLSLQLLLDPEGDESLVQIRARWESMKKYPNEGILLELLAMYERLWNRDLPSASLPSAASKRREASETAFRLFKRVFVARKPLGLGEAIGDYSLALPKLCRSVLVESERGKLQISHSSARDYLILKISGSLTEFIGSEDFNRPGILDKAERLAQHLANLEICKTCLSTLFIENSHGPSPPLLEYAAYEWVAHYKIVEGPDGSPDDISQLALALFSPSHATMFRRWIKLWEPEGTVKDNAIGSPLYFAIMLKLYSVAKALIAEALHINTPGGRLFVPLQAACAVGSLDVTRKLLESNAEVDAVGGVYGTALQAAVAGGHDAIVRTLVIDYGANVNIQGGIYMNAIQAALSRNNEHVLMLLIDHGAQYNPTGGQIWIDIVGQWDDDILSYCARNMPASKPFGYMEKELLNSLLDPCDDFKQRQALWRVAAGACRQPIQVSPEANRTKQGRMDSVQLIRTIRNGSEFDDWHCAGCIPARLVWAVLQELLRQLFPDESVLKGSRDGFDKVLHLLMEFARLTLHIFDITSVEPVLRVNASIIEEYEKALGSVIKMLPLKNWDKGVLRFNQNHIVEGNRLGSSLERVREVFARVSPQAAVFEDI